MSTVALFEPVSQSIDSDTDMDGADVTLPRLADCTEPLALPAPAVTVPVCIEEADDCENVINLSQRCVSECAATAGPPVCNPPASTNVQLVHNVQNV
jgi:hypothetical protein